MRWLREQFSQVAARIVLVCANCEILKGASLSSLSLFPLSWARRSSTARSIYYNLAKNTYTHSQRAQCLRVCHKQQVWASVCFIFSLRTAAAINSTTPYTHKMMRTHWQTFGTSAWESTHSWNCTSSNTKASRELAKLCGAKFRGEKFVPYIFYHWATQFCDEGGECTDAVIR